MLRSLRKNPFVNAFFRKLFKGSNRQLSNGLGFMIARWPTSGIVDCSFAGQDLKLYNECDDGLVDELYYEMDYAEESDLKLFILLAKNSKTIIDIGANTGGFSVLAGLANNSASMYAIEPYAPNFNRLKINLGLNNCSNVKPLQVAMGESIGMIEFTVPESNDITMVSSVNGEFSKAMHPSVKWKKQTVPLATLDHVKSSNNIGKIDLIKCDVETYEMSVFRGMDVILREDRPVIIFESFLNDERQTFFNEVLKKYNYYVYGVLNEGLVHLNNGFRKDVGGLNYLLSSVPPQGNFINYKYLASHPDLIIAA
jgi:FkbM family methyltransferase